MIGLIAALLVLLVAGVVLWLGNANMAPPTPDHVKQAIPDDRIPH